MPEPETRHEPRHETRDVNAKGVVITAASLAGMIIAAVLVCWGLFGYFGRTINKQQPQPYSWAGSEPEQRPSFPRLEGAIHQDAREQRQPTLPLYYPEEQRLGSYGWVNEKEGIAHIPIDRAMQIIAEQEKKKK
jgi:hypothetical protein